jgi:hypothetical protein
MSAVVDLVEDVVGGVVEAFGDVVESVVDVVKDVGSAIDDYVIQPILDDPLTAIATVAGAYFLGPAAAGMFGTSATVGAGIAAGAANTAAGLAQGEDFDEAIKGGLAAGVGTWAGGELTNAFGGSSATPSPSDALASGNTYIDVPFDAATDALASAPTSLAPPAVAAPVTPSPMDALDDFLSPGSIDGAAASAAAPTAAASPLQSATDGAASAASQAQGPLQSLNTNIPQVDMGAAAPAASAPNLPSFTSGLDTSLTSDYGLTSGMKPDFGLQVPKFTPDTPAFDIYGEPNYSITPKGISGGPGLQVADAPNLASMGGGQGLTADMSGLPEFRYSDASLDPSIRGTTDTWTGDSGKTYGASTPDVTVSQRAITPTTTDITYDPKANMGTPGVLDQIGSGKIVDAAKNVGTQAVDWVKNANPWVLGAGALSLMGGAGGPPSSAPPPRGSTQDKNFNKSLDLYEYMRDKANYGGNLERYGQTGGEHRFFQNTRFVPIPIPGQSPTPAKMGGLIQMKHFAQGGAMPQRQMSPQNAQGGQGQRPPMPQRPRDPKMAYYQYGNPPVQAKAMGGLSQVHSMSIGGGADGRSDDVNAVLSDGEYVMDAESVAMLGNGSSKAGAAKLDQMRSKLRQHKGKNLASGKISPNAKSPLAYLKGA